MQITDYEIKVVKQKIEDLQNILHEFRDQETAICFLSILDMIDYYLKTLEVVIDTNRSN